MIGAPSQISRQHLRELSIDEFISCIKQGTESEEVLAVSLVFDYVDTLLERGLCVDISKMLDRLHTVELPPSVATSFLFITRQFRDTLNPARENYAEKLRLRFTEKTPDYLQKLAKVW